MSLIGQNVKRARNTRRLTQQQLANAAGTTQYTVSHIERGLRDPHPTTLLKLADALGVEVADFFREGDALLDRALASPRLYRKLHSEEALFDLVHDAILEQEKQAEKRAREGGPAHIYVKRFEEEVVTRLLERNPAELAKAYIDLVWRYRHSKREVDQLKEENAGLQEQLRSREKPGETSRESK